MNNGGGSQRNRPNRKAGANAAKKRRKNAQKASKAAKVTRLDVDDPDLTPGVTVPPPAAPARLQSRHRGLLLGLVVMVLAPLACVVFYLFQVAEDQYLSTTAFTVRSQESSESSDLLGGLAQFTGASIASDSDILYEFIQSREIMSSVQEQVDLKTHYAQHWPNDWVFSLWPEASIEDLEWYWQRMVQLSYDAGSGLIEVQVAAFDAATAHQIAQIIVDESQRRLNSLNDQARTDAMRFAEADLEAAVLRLKKAREDLTQFRARTRIVDPDADIQGRMGVLNNLQYQLAEALVEFELLLNSVGADDLRTVNAQKRIEAIRGRINIERDSFTASGTDENGAPDGEDYPSLISEFEALVVEREFAEELYRAALTSLEIAREAVVRNSRYLATYIQPTTAEEAEQPRRFVLSALAALFLFLAWSILVLIYYSIRDRN